MKRAGPRRVKTLLGGSERELPRTPQDELCQACRWSGPRRGQGRQRVRNNNPDKEEEEVRLEEDQGVGKGLLLVNLVLIN